jgi:hypothetical protein
LLPPGFRIYSRIAVQAMPKVRAAIAIQVVR